MNRLGAVSAVLFLVPHPVRCQISSGTVVVFRILPDRVIVAADSKAIRDNGPPRYTDCKISAFRERVVFASTGHQGYVYRRFPDTLRTWSNISEARNAVRHFGAIESANARAKALGDSWVESIRDLWQSLANVHLDYVKSQARDGVICSVLFAAADELNVAVVVHQVVLRGHRIEVTSPDIRGCAIDQCVFGPPVASEYVGLTSERARAETWSASTELLARTSKEMLKAVRLVDLTIAYDETEVVGPPIDALDLRASGTVQWFQRKYACAEYDD